MGQEKHKKRVGGGRRWLRYSLRTLFLVLTLSSIVLGVWVSRAQRQRRALAAVEKLGGYWVFEGAELGHSTTSKDSWTPRQLAEHYFKSVTTVALKGNHVRDPDLKLLQGLPGLQWLSLAGTQVTDAGLVHLKGLTGLQVLWLRETQVTDAGLVHLKGLTELQWLLLGDTQVTDAGLVHLKGLTGLQVLALDGTRVTDAAVDELRKSLPNAMISH